MNLREQLKVAMTKARSLKTKQAQTKAWDRVREIRREIRLLLDEQCSRYAMQSIKGTVTHFRPGDEHYLVSTCFGNMWLTPTADERSKSWYPSTCCIEYSVGQTVIIEIDTEVNCQNWDQAFLQLIPKRVYGGTVNEQQYAELDKRTDLAFFKHSSGGMTGLFASKAGA